MKKNILFLFLTGVLFAGVLSMSCKKDAAPDYGIPTIARVAQPLDSSSIVTGSFTQWVIIYGTHLGSAQSVSFNDQEVPYKTFYASDTSVTVQIPRAIPKNVTNTITVKTKGGTATFQFTTLIPDLKVTGMLNEYTAAGDTLTVTGSNFDLYNLDTSATSISFTGGSSANVVRSTATTLKVIVPAGAQPGPITVKGIAPLNISVTTTAWWWDNRNFLFDMSHFSGWNGNSYLSSGPDPAPVNGPYFKVAKSWQGGWAWDPFCSNNCAMPAELVNDPSQ
ncbi:MAG TPA: IPT/TIG domain-containing protein, partial [Puia sp.]